MSTLTPPEITGPKTYTDRSRLLSYQSCHRKRWLEYETPTDGLVNGVRPIRLNRDLLIGSAAHKGVEGLLRIAAEEGGRRPTPEEIDGIIGEVLDGGEGSEGVVPMMKTHGLSLGENEDATFVYHETIAMIEATIRGYEKFVLPQLLERFTVVEVEQEELGLVQHDGFSVLWGARLDALLMDKDNLNLYVLSLKTAKEHGKRDEDSATHDMQGISETFVAEQRLGKWQEILDNASNAQEIQAMSKVHGIPYWFAHRYATGASPNITGVKMEFLLKGRKSEWPKGSGRWSYSNPLISPWKKSDGLGEPAYAWKFEFKDPYGMNHRLGKGWNRIKVWEDIGVKAWIEKLANEDIQGMGPGAGIASMYVLPMEYFRNQEHIERWKRQAVGQEKRIYAGREKMKGLIVGQIPEEVLDEFFPQFTKSCDWPVKCDFQEICFGPSQYLLNPLESGLYQIRDANHKVEEEIN